MLAHSLSGVKHFFGMFFNQSAICLVRADFQYIMCVTFMSTIFFQEIDGREDRIRTCDPLVPSQVLYQAELLPDYRNFFTF